jgi:hypothetical protein
MSPEDLKANYKFVFSSNEGQIVMNDLQKRCHIFAPVFSGENTHEMAFKDGQRNVVLFLLNMLSDNPPPQQETTNEDT